MEKVFEPEIRNVTYSELFGGKLLVDHEHIVKDICEYCNNISLSKYDLAGAVLVQEINKSYDASKKIIPFNFETSAWLLKTHFNHVRVIPQKNTKQYFPVAQDIYNGIIEKDIGLFKYVRLYVEGWRGLPYFWDESDIRKIQFFSYKSVVFPYQEILVSNFRIKWLDTFVFIPSNLDYSNFEFRVNLTTDALRANYGFDLQDINPEAAIKDTRVQIQKVEKTENLLKCIKQQSFSRWNRA